ncbi:26S proteasome non-ATPase regulatory subunit [Parasponia andersonii]|uniref:26S proteasome non-ATPase regulatory subunit n=1 Tax=Parasponia andersonii TaxID=3476 RepID=A0A2P5AR63_PARAD|nr:26S proteasome non-ATPase regulatory subunit [Parasponia andersonii]
MEEYSVDDPTQLLEAASDYAYYPGVQNDASAKIFLDRFPLPVIINALQTKADVPGLENILVACLERIFKTKYGASLIPQYMDFVRVGLKVDSQIVRCLACKTVLCLLENLNEESVSSLHLIVDYDVYPLLLDCLINGNEQVATASMDAIKMLAGFPQGKEIIFPTNSNEATHLGELANRCSSLGRVRVLALIVKLFSVSNPVASIIYKSNLLRLFEEEIKNTNDTLVTLSVLELLYELTEVQNSREFLSGNSLLLLLSSIISNKSMESILRSRAMMISGRLLHNNYMFVDELSVQTVISAIDRVLDSAETADADEFEAALEALGQIGSPIQGAELLLSSSPPIARHVIDAAFDQHGRGKQLAGLHALGNISGETRMENTMILNNNAEESLRRLIYETLSKTSKLTPSGFVLSVLRQDSKIRLAVYRMITGLVARPWFLMEICSKQEIINTVTDANTETTKIGMEARHNCCKAIQKALILSSKVIGDTYRDAIAEKVHEAVRRGPYLAKKLETQPAVMTAERF